MLPRPNLRMLTVTFTLGACALCATSAALAAPAKQASEEDVAAARTAVEHTVDDVLALLRSAELAHEAKIAQLQTLAEERFDFPRIAKLVLGKNRRKLSEAQQAEFESEFKRYLTVSYADAIKRFSDEKIEITGGRGERNGDVTIQSRVVGGSADGVLLDYRMRGRKGPWRVIDVTIEGVSLVQNFRSQIQELVTSKGADHLVETLRAKNDNVAALSTD